MGVPSAVGEFRALDAVGDSGGAAVAVPEGRILGTMRHAIAAEGVSLCPEAAAAVLAIEMLAAKGAIARDERVVLFNTGAATKYVEAVALDLPIIEDPHQVDYGALA